jgi:hypothetical protein
LPTANAPARAQPFCNKLAINVFDSYQDILDTACGAWTFFGNDSERIATITARSWAGVNV